MEDLKIYDEWNEIKKKIQVKDKLGYFKERQIWWCSIGQNLGSEIYGKGATFTRPVLVFKKLSGHAFLGLLMTSKAKSGSWYVTIKHKGEEVTALLHQVRVFDKKRLVDRFGQVDDADFEKIKKGFMALYCS